MCDKITLSLADVLIIKNDEYVKDLTTQQRGHVIDAINEYELLPKIHVFESIHGHIVKMKRRKGRFIPGSEGSPVRIDKDDLSFFTAMGDDLRHFELSTDSVLIGL